MDAVNSNRLVIRFALATAVLLLCGSVPAVMAATTSPADGSIIPLYPIITVTQTFPGDTDTNKATAIMVKNSVLKKTSTGEIITPDFAQFSFATWDYTYWPSSTCSVSIRIGYKNLDMNTGYDLYYGNTILSHFTTGITPPPTFTAISPASAALGSSGTYTVTGSNFDPGAQVAIAGGSGGTTWVYATAVNVVNANTITCTFAIPADAPLGGYVVYVKNPFEYWFYTTNAPLFTVTGGTPTVTAISPASAARGATGTYTVTGTNFVAGAEVAVQGGTAGTTTVYATGETVLSATQVRCTLAIPTNAYPGPYTVFVRNPGGGWISKAGAFTVTPPTPTVTGISPASAARGATGTCTVTGTNFVAGAEVAVKGGTGGTTTVYATGETVLSATQVRCTLAIPTNAYPGPYTVFVRNPGGGWISKAGAFTVTPPTPTVTGISPASAARGATGTCTVTGTNFVAGAEVAVKGGTGGTTTVYATGETVLSATQVRCTLAIPTNAYPGPYTVFVRNPGGGWISKAGAFTVTPPTPTVTGISPASAARGATGTCTVTGTNFVAGAEVAVKGGTGGTTTVYATGETVLSATQVRCTLAIPANAYPGAYTVFVRNPGGSWVNKASAFTVTSPAPTVTAIAPASAAVGSSGTYTVTGTNFVNGAEVAVQGGTGGTMTVYATGESVVNANTITCTLAIPAGAYPGPYTVFVRNPGGGWISKAGAFTVTSPAPTVTAISPASAARGAIGTFTVTGTNFVAGAEVAVQGGTGGTTTVYATGETFVSSTQLRCTLAIPAGAYPGGYYVYVRNPGVSWKLSATPIITVTSPAPTVTAIAPASALPGTGLATVTVTGTGFVAGTEVAIQGGTGGTTTVYATGEAFVSATQVRCALSVPANAYPGGYYVYVRNPGTSTWTRSATTLFTVTAPASTVTAISPASAAPGATLTTVTVTGTGFTNGVQVAIQGGTGGTTTVYATGETWLSPTQVRCTLTLPANAFPGGYYVFVRNPTAGSYTKSATRLFTVTGAAGGSAAAADARPAPVPIPPGEPTAGPVAPADLRPAEGSVAAV